MASRPYTKIFFSFDILMFSCFTFFRKLFLYLEGRVGPDVVVLAIGDGGELGLLAPLLLLNRDAPVKVCPVLEEVAVSLQLPYFIEKRVPSSRQHEVEIQIGFPSLGTWILDLGDHLVKSGVWAEVGEIEDDAAVLEVPAGADVLQGQGHVQLRQGQCLDMIDKRLFELFLRSY